jgi:hypothetical protein
MDSTFCVVSTQNNKSPARPDFSLGFVVYFTAIKSRQINKTAVLPMLLIAPPTNVIDDQFGNHTRYDGKEHIGAYKNDHLHEISTSLRHGVYHPEGIGNLPIIPHFSTR